jgi:hypothetical protein
MAVSNPRTEHLPHGHDIHHTSVPSFSKYNFLRLVSSSRVSLETLLFSKAVEVSSSLGFMSVMSSFTHQEEPVMLSSVDFISPHDELYI